uniref:NADH dehydrogenase subunit 2 n=1 Tax=Pentidionis agamae TaxID=3091002 RepID=UPI0030020A39|nr:NADH dehydrogenase subunit 2 [Pentidionis agamae]
MFKMMVTTNMLISPMMMANMNSWVMIWVFLEISSISFISLMKMKQDNEGSMIYFLAQSLGSFLIIMSMIKSSMFLMNIMSEKVMMNMGLMIKLGLMPFHQWFVKMGSMISMDNLFLLSSIQKMAPLLLISMNFSTTMTIMILTSMIMSVIIQMMQTSMKKLLIFSSIFQNSPIMMSFMLNTKMAMLYFMLYTTTLFMVIKEMKKNMTNSLNHQTNKTSLTMMLNVSSMAGMPPLMGFIPKWILLKMMSKETNMMVNPIILVITSVISFFIYFRMMTPTTLSTKKKMKTMTMTKTTLFMQMIMPIFLMVM